MKKSLLIILCSLLGFTGFSQGYPTLVEGCLAHRLPTGGGFGIPYHVLVVTLTSNPSSIDIYIGGSYAGTTSTATSVNGNWVYELNMGTISIGNDPSCIDVEIIETGQTYDPTVATDYTICHCDLRMKDACMSKKAITTGGQMGLPHHIATVAFESDVQGLDMNLWYWDGSVMQGPYLPLTKTFTGGIWVYTYDLGLATLSIPNPVKLYTSWGTTTPSVNDFHLEAAGCYGDFLYACYRLLPPRTGMTPHRMLTVVYEPGIAGLDVYLWWNDGSGLVMFSPISKTFVNGYWKYTYDLGIIGQNEPPCYDVYPTMVTSQPNPTTAPHHLVCRCSDCDASFTYCVGSADPNTIILNLNTQNPLAQMNLTVTDENSTVVYSYSGPAFSKKFTVPGDGKYQVCVYIDNEGNRCEYCLEVCRGKDK